MAKTQKSLKNFARWGMVVSLIEGDSRDQISLLPACIDDYVAPEALARLVDAFVASLDLTIRNCSACGARRSARWDWQATGRLKSCHWTAGLQARIFIVDTTI